MLESLLPHVDVRVVERFQHRVLVRARPPPGQVGQEGQERGESQTAGDGAGNVPGKHKWHSTY